MLNFCFWYLKSIGTETKPHSTKIMVLNILLYSVLFKQAWVTAKTKLSTRPDCTKQLPLKYRSLNNYIISYKASS